MRAKMSILALPWARQVNSLCGRFRQYPLRDRAGADDDAADGADAIIGGEGVATRDGVSEADEDGDGHRDGELDDLAEFLHGCRSRVPSSVLGEPATQSSSFNGEKAADREKAADGEQAVDGEQIGW